MAKCNKKINAQLEDKRKKYVNIGVENNLISSLGSIASYSLQNVSKPIKKGVLYQNGIGLLSTSQMQSLGIKYLQDNQIPFIIGGINPSKGMLGILTPNDSKFEEVYLKLVQIYENNSQLFEQLRKEKNILEFNILAQLGFEYEVTGPKVELDLVGKPYQIFLNKKDNLEGRIVSAISPLIGYQFAIKEEVDSLTKELILNEIKETKKELYKAAA